MTSLQAIEAAVKQLEHDVHSGASDWLAEEALADLKGGRCHER